MSKKKAINKILIEHLIIIVKIKYLKFSKKDKNTLSEISGRTAVVTIFFSVDFTVIFCIRFSLEFIMESSILTILIFSDNFSKEFSVDRKSVV